MPDKYVVKAGDSWAKIAGEMYGDQRMFAELMRANPNIAMMRPGQTLKLPDPRKNAYVSNTEAAVSGMTNQWKDSKGNVVSPGYTGYGADSLNTIANAVANKQMLTFNPNTPGYRNMMYASYKGGTEQPYQAQTFGKPVTPPGMPAPYFQLATQKPDTGIPAPATQKTNTGIPAPYFQLATQKPNTGFGKSGTGSVPAAQQFGQTLEAQQRQGFTSQMSAAQSPLIHPELALRNNFGVAYQKLINSMEKSQQNALNSGPAYWIDVNGNKQTQQPIGAGTIFTPGQQTNASTQPVFGLGPKGTRPLNASTLGSGPPPAPSTITSNTTPQTTNLDIKIQNKLNSFTEAVSSNGSKGSYPSWTPDELAQLAKSDPRYTVDDYVSTLLASNYVVDGNGNYVNYKGNTEDGVALPPGVVPSLPSVDIKQALEGLPAISLPWGYGPPTFSQSGRRDPQTIATGALPNYGVTSQVTGRWNVGGG